MKKTANIILMILFSLFILSGCQKKESMKSPESINVEWVIKSSAESEKTQEIIHTAELATPDTPPPPPIITPPASPRKATLEERDRVIAPTNQ